MYSQHIFTVNRSGKEKAKLIPFVIRWCLVAYLQKFSAPKSKSISYSSVDSC